MAEIQTKRDTPVSFFERRPLRSRFPLFTAMTFGIVHVQHIDIEPDLLYIIDSKEDNVWYVYDRDSVQRGVKTLWKLGFAKIDYYEVVSKNIDLTVMVPEIPSFDEQFGGNGGGGWVTIDFSIRVSLSISSQNLGKLKECHNPQRDVQDAVLKVARAILPFVSYQDALTANMKENIADWVRAYDEVKRTGFLIKGVEIEMVDGSKRVAQAYNDRFDRLLQAKDKSDIAMMFKELDDHAINAYLSMGGAPDAGAILAAKSRIADQSLRLLMASGKDPLSAYQLSAQGADKKMSDPQLQNHVAEKAFDMIEESDWPALKPKGKTFSERLNWERSVLQERIPLWLLDDPDQNSFTIKIGEHTLQVRWEDSDAVPQAWIDGKDRQREFAILSSSGWNYDRRTMWDVYQVARRLLNAQSD